MFANFANFFVESFVNTISYFIVGGVGPTLELQMNANIANVS